MINTAIELLGAGPAGALADLHERMPRWLQIPAYGVLLIATVYGSLYQYTKDIYLTGLIQEYRSGDQEQRLPLPVASENHYVRYDTSTSTRTNRQGLFTMAVGPGYLWPFKTINLHVGISDSSTQPVPISAWSIWSLFTPPKEIHLIYVERARAYVRNTTDANVAYENAGVASAVAAAPSRAASGRYSLVSVARAQGNSSYDPSLTRSVRLHSLALSSPESDVSPELDARFSVHMTLNGASVDARPLEEPVVIPSDLGYFLFGTQSIPVSHEGRLRLTLTRPRFLLPAFEVAQCEVELSGQQLGTITSIPCVMSDAEIPELTLSFEVFPHLSVGFMSRELGNDAHTVRIWLDVERDTLPAIATVGYQLPALFRTRFVTEPRLEAAHFYNYGIPTYTSQFPVTATVTLSSGSIWQGTARIFSLEEEPTTAAGYYAKATLFYRPNDADDSDLEYALDLLETAVDMDPAFRTRGRAQGSHCISNTRTD